MAVTYLAPAKVNLFLHVGAPAQDGFHPVCSAMVFADMGDVVSIGGGSDLSVSGPFAMALEGGGENLVTRALAAFEPHLARPVGLHLEKRLPVAAGLGGGSSDAGAALRLLRDVHAPSVTDRALEEIAARLGSDGAACLWARNVLSEGRGERLSPWPSMPELHGVLVNPGIGVSTPAVYRRFDELGVFSDVVAPARPAAFADIASLIGWLKTTRNDLQAAALSLAPEIGTVLSELEGSSLVRLARMSGSGATCFALCGDQDAARQLGSDLARTHPGWWVQACRLS